MDNSKETLEMIIIESNVEISCFSQLNQIFKSTIKILQFFI